MKHCQIVSFEFGMNCLFILGKALEADSDYPSRLFVLTREGVIELFVPLSLWKQC